MLALAEKQMLIQALGQVIVDEVKTAVEPLAARVQHIENTVCRDDLAAVSDVIAHVKELRESIDAKLAALPVPINGKDGIDGVNGKDADMNAVEQMIAANHKKALEHIDETIAALPPPEKGEKGDKGDPGEPGKDGTNGRDGIDGKNVSLDEIRTVLADLVAKAVAGIPIPRNCVGTHIDRRGHLFLRFSDGSDSDLGEVVGRDGKDCDLAVVRTQVAEFLATIEKPKDGKDGRDGFSLEDFKAVSKDDGRIVTLSFADKEFVASFDLEFPVPIERGMWKQGDYKRADIVQRDGSMWIAERNTNGVPGQPDSGWRLSTKRGRDGKEGPQGKQGPPGTNGRDGRDLTQLGFDGRKY